VTHHEVVEQVASAAAGLGGPWHGRWTEVYQVVTVVDGVPA
jgi:hypothetical protein